MSVILIAGDCHGEWYDLTCVINQAIKKYKIDKVIQVGDFGYYPLVFSKHEKLKFPVPVYALMGNHENHEFIYDNIREKTYKLWEEKHNIFLIQQGDTWEEDGCKFGFLGKAFNVDRKQFGSTKHRDTNYILNVEVREAIEKFNNFGQLDFLITHSCPHSIGVGMEGKMCFVETIEKYITRPFNVSTGPLNDCGEQALTNLWNGLTLKPKEWIYGHFHCVQQKQVQDTVFTCIGCVDSSGGHEFARPFIIDTQKKTFEAFPSDTLLNSKGFHRTYIADEPIRKNPYPV